MPVKRRKKEMREKDKKGDDKGTTTEGPIIEVLARADGENSYFCLFMWYRLYFQDPVES